MKCNDNEVVSGSDCYLTQGQKRMKRLIWYGGGVDVGYDVGCGDNDNDDDNHDYD